MRLRWRSRNRRRPRDFTEPAAIISALLILGAIVWLLITVAPQD